MTSKEKKNKKRKKKQKTEKKTKNGKKKNKQTNKQTRARGKTRTVLNTHCIRMMYSGYTAPLIQRTHEVLGL